MREDQVRGIIHCAWLSYDTIYFSWVVIPRPPVLYSHSRIPIPTPAKILSCTAAYCHFDHRKCTFPRPVFFFFLDRWKEKCFYREFP